MKLDLEYKFTFFLFKFFPPEKKYIEFPTVTIGGLCYDILKVVCFFDEAYIPGIPDTNKNML